MWRKSFLPASSCAERPIAMTTAATRLISHGHSELPSTWFTCFQLGNDVTRSMRPAVRGHSISTTETQSPWMNELLEHVPRLLNARAESNLDLLVVHTGCVAWVAPQTQRWLHRVGQVEEPLQARRSAWIIDRRSKVGFGKALR
ncbi:hypothetical protein Ae201684P_004062 [Aphanomyces euteiches]|nr:hypothetical protein Ae201684P_004062 [Aphanomyces euteiches]